MGTSMRIPLDAKSLRFSLTLRDGGKQPVSLQTFAVVSPVGGSSGAVDARSLMPARTAGDTER